MNWAGLDFSLLLPPFIAGLIVLASHVPLGREVLKRGIVFVDLAVAQVAGLGIIAASAFDWPLQGWQAQMPAVLAALAAAALLTALERRWPKLLEPLIGSLFVLAASLAALLSAHDPHGNEHLQDVLLGQILWVGWDVIPAAAIASLMLLLVWNLFRQRWPWVFHVCLALAVTLSVQLVGVYLVFASLIFPALIMHAQPQRAHLAWGFAIGGAGYALGLIASALFDWPAGPVICVSLALVALLVLMLISLSDRLNRAVNS